VWRHLNEVLGLPSVTTPIKSRQWQCAVEKYLGKDSMCSGVWKDTKVDLGTHMELCFFVNKQIFTPAMLCAYETT
jgi:hypothetical protein